MVKIEFFGLRALFCFKIGVAFCLVGELESYEVESVEQGGAEAVEVVDG